MNGTRTRALLRALTVAAAGAALTVGGLTPAAAAPGSTRSETRTVSLRGASVEVPRSWPVVRLSGKAGCVRFDRRAVYVGDPSRITCPPHLVGRTAAVHLTTKSVQGVTAPDRVVSSPRSQVSVVVSTGSRKALARRIAESVSYEGGRAVLQAAPTPARPRTFSASGGRALSDQRALSSTTFTGQGFDACTARSVSELSTWYAASPYKAVNMYIGGASRGCSQPNLSADWVRQVVAQGWVLIPTYVGLQAPCREYPNRIDPANAAAQGTAGADDAILQLNALGLGGGNPVYFDIEAFSYTNAACLQAVQTFLHAWTVRLHERGYGSGVYSSANTMKALLVDKQGDPSFAQPDAIWFARWPADSKTQPGDPTLRDPAIPDQYWSDHQRIHQYRGGHQETWGGVTINIDSNTVDAPVAPGQLAPDGAFVAVAGQSQVYRVAGGAPIATTSWEAVNESPQPVQTLSPTQFDSFPDRPADGTFVLGGSTGNVYRIVRGVATHVPSWAPYGGPRPTVTIDQAAIDNAGTGGIWNRLSSGRPSVRTTGPTTLGSIASKVRFTWAGGISSSAVKNYDVRWRKARWDGRYQPWQRPAGWQTTTNLDGPLGMKAGHTYCVSVRARNRAGQLSSWSGSRCTARALDDRRMSASSGWKSRSGARFYSGTYRVTTQKGATLSRAGAKVKRVGLVATRCQVCGIVNVLVDGRKVGRVNLAAPATRRRQVVMLPAFKRTSGTVTVKVRSAGKRVQIDGIVLSRG